MKLFLIRLLTAFRVLFQYKRHWFICYLTDEQIENHLSGNQIEIDLHFHRLDKYNVKSILFDVGNSMDEDELVLDKAAFQAEAELHKNKN